jgi:hypothetical protein
MARGDLVPAMECHAVADHACIGFAAVVGFESVGLRLASVMGRFDPAEVDVEGIELHTLRSVLHVHGTMHPEPCATKCDGCKSICGVRSSETFGLFRGEV